MMADATALPPGELTRCKGQAVLAVSLLSVPLLNWNYLHYLYYLV